VARILLLPLSMHALAPLRRPWPALALALALAACTEPAVEAPPPPVEPGTPIAAAVAEPGPVLAGRWGARGDLHAELVRFYEGHSGEPAWSDGERLGRQGRALVGRLEEAAAVGLSPAEYESARLTALVDALTTGRSPRDDLLAADPQLTAAALLYASDLSSGRVDPDDARLPWHIDKPRRHFAGELAAALDRGDLGGWLDAVEPRTALYASQLEMLHRYREIAAAGGWPPVPAGPVLELGDPIGRERLLPLLECLDAGGDLTALDRAVLDHLREEEDGGEGPAVYHLRLAEAVGRFQRRHGIEVDGTLGPETLAELAVPAEARVRQILLNLERARWIERDFPERYLHINVPAFELEARDGERAPLEMSIVVGRTDWMTPLFRDAMTTVEINPYWHVPASIAARELAVEAAEDAEAFRADGYEVFSGPGPGAERLDPRTVDWRVLDPEDPEVRIRQRPGPTNALGRIKFLFPNRHNVYLHDTPADGAFDRTERALSHGCIRLERPLDLAAWVFAGQEGWDRERVEETIASGEHTVVPLEEAIPVYILYWTAWMEDGRAQFRRDVYGVDAELGRRFGEERGAGRQVAGG